MRWGLGTHQKREMKTGSSPFVDRKKRSMLSVRNKWKAVFYLTSVWNGNGGVHLAPCRNSISSMSVDFSWG